jgi:putative N6-adenine-specific DNA methylase
MGDLRFFAACTLGLEPALESELTELGARDLQVRRGGVAFRGDVRLGQACNLWLRCAIRVQEELAVAAVSDGDDLYEAARLDWDRWMTPDQTLAVFAAVRDAPGLRHSGYAALRVKDAVVDVLREKHGRRPSVDTKKPDVPLRLVVQGERMRLYRDWSGLSLHKRGWRKIQVKSPLNEALAAGLLRLTGWDRASPLVDPMCGSGTFPVEAALWASDRAPGLGRAFAFERWIDHDRRGFHELLDDAHGRATSRLDFPILGGDRHPGALDLARQGARAAGVERLVRLTRKDARDLVPAAPPGVVVVNPPYGERIGTGGDLVDSWAALGDFLHQRCGGAVAWVLCGNRELTRHLRLRASRRMPVRNGTIDCRWLRYDIRARD